MNFVTKTAFALCAILPFTALGADSEVGIETTANIIEFFNATLVVTAFISFKHFFIPGERDYPVFHIVNILMVALFYCVSLPYIISHKQYYEGFSNLSDAACVRAYFFSFDSTSITQLIVIAGAVVNVLFTARYARAVV